jgi:hypothetical protein
MAVTDETRGGDSLPVSVVGLGHLVEEELVAGIKLQLGRKLHPLLGQILSNFLRL